MARPAVLVLSDVDLAAYRAGFARGERTSELPYGMERLEDHDWRLVGPGAPGGGRVVTALEHRTGLRLAAPLRGLRVRDAGVTLAMLEHWAQVPALLRRVPFTGYRRRPLVSFVCWAAEDLRRGTDAERRRALRALRGSDLVAYWSENQTADYLAAGIPQDRLLPLPFGTETGYFRGDVDASRPHGLVAVGMDRGRDYRTLAAAVEGTELAVEVLARPENLAGIELPPGVRPRGVLPPAEYADLLRATRVVVIPTHDLAYPTGQTVALDAAAAGCAVVVTRTEAMAEYFTDDETALMPPPGDATALRAALRRLSTDDALRRRLAAAAQARVLAGHDSARMWDRLAEELVRRGWLPQLADRSASTN